MYICINPNKLTKKVVKKINKLLKKERKKHEQMSKDLEFDFGEDIYILQPDGSIKKELWRNSYEQSFALALGMVFKTEAELDKEANRRYIESKLRMYAKKHNDHKKEKWDGKNNHYQIVYNYTIGKLLIAGSCIEQDINGIYFTSRSVAANAIKTIGENNIKKLLGPGI